MSGKLEKFVDGDKIKVDFPAHCCIIGKTLSGKTFLASAIINRIDDIFMRKMETHILIVLSPYKEIEDSILRQLDTKWIVIHFSVNVFTEDTLNQVINYLQREKLLGNEIVLLIDDLMIQTISSTNISTFLVRAFATFRHHNIAVMATVQSSSSSLVDVLQNSTFIFVMQTFGCFQVLSKITRMILGVINVPSLIRKIYPLLEDDRKGSYIFVNTSHEADRNRLFAISNDVFADKGFTKRYLYALCTESSNL